MITHILLLNSTGLIMNIWFKLANPSFEELFCENKDAPEKECHGCCMIKKINQTPDEKTDFSVPSLLPNHELSNYIVSNQIPVVSNYFEILKVMDQTYLFSYRFRFMSDCFHPPELP